MPAQQPRRLSDLFKRGQPVTLDDGQGGVTVWVQKLSPIETDAARRAANAARARILAVRNDHDSDVYWDLRDEVEGYGRETLVAYLSLQKRDEIEPQIEAELGGDEETWGKDGYLTGLRDAWPELEDDYVNAGVVEAEDGEPNPEAIRVHDELARFAAEVAKRVHGDLERYQRDLDADNDTKLREEVLQSVITGHANGAWLTEFRRQEVYYGTRISAKNITRYFANRDELNHLSIEVLAALTAAMRQLTVEPMEGKGSPGSPASSPSSEQPDVEEESSSSPQDATQ